jgi:Glutamine amidotransferase domain
MCGIVGVAGKITHTVKNTVFKDMLDVCQVRGRDSTGVIKVRNDADQSYTWTKAVGPPANLFDYRKYESEIERGDALALVGHTRSRTVGDINIKNAHPFDYVDEQIIGVHNGTLREHYKLDGHHHTKVDSDVLYGHLAKNGPKKTFNLVKGAYACVWWDGNKKTLNFIRNDERPLWFTWSKDMEMMFWASEIWMFAVVERKIALWNGVKDDGVGKYVQIKPHQLWSFTINPKADKDSSVLTMKPSQTIEPEKEVVRYTGNYGVQGGKVWTREDGDWKPKVTPPLAGGEVTNPFVQQDLLDDDISDIIPWGAEVPPHCLVQQDITGNPEESGSTEIGNVSFMKTSATGKDSTTESSPSPRFPREILCLPAKNSKGSQPTNKSEPSDASKESLGNIVSLSEQRRVSRPPTSVREVKKVGWFIRDNFKDIEYSIDQFEENTKGICCHCKEPVGDLDEVFEFIDKNNFVCKTCVTPHSIARDATSTSSVYN